MKGFFDAYAERLQRNQKEIFELIKSVQQLDPTIEAYIYSDNNCYKKSVVFFKDEEINSICFHEVPYRWSGCGYDEHSNSHSGKENCSLPFSAEDVIKTFKPVTSVRWRYKDKHGIESVYFKSKKQYLEWYSFLKKYDKAENLHHEI